MLMRVSTCWKNLGRLEELSGDATSATTSLQKALAYGERAARLDAQPPVELLDTYSTLGDLEVDVGEPARALDHYQKALTGFERRAAAAPDAKAVPSVVTATVRFDNLTRKYPVTRMVEGRIDRADSMDREDLAWTWLTNQFEKMPLFRSVALEVNGEYYVRVRAHSTPRNMSFVWPWQADDVVGLAKFTFMR